MLSIDLSERVALVTGGSRGIGRAVCELLARAGARVAVSFRADSTTADEVVAAIRSGQGEAMAVAGDIADPRQARQLIRDVLAAWQRLDILVNNAGVWEEDEAGRGDLETWDRTLAVNVRGAFLVTDSAVPHLARERGSSLVISSDVGPPRGARQCCYAGEPGCLSVVS